MGTPLVDASRSRVRTTKLLDQVFEKMWGDHHGSVGLSVVLLQLLVSSQGRPQSVHEVAPADRARVLAEFAPLQFPIATPSSAAVSLSVKKRQQCTGAPVKCGGS